MLKRTCCVTNAVLRCLLQMASTAVPQALTTPGLTAQPSLEHTVVGRGLAVGSAGRRRKLGSSQSGRATKLIPCLWKSSFSMSVYPECLYVHLPCSLCQSVCLDIHLSVFSTSLSLESLYKYLGRWDNLLVLLVDEIKAVLLLPKILSIHRNCNGRKTDTKRLVSTCSFFSCSF